MLGVTYRRRLIGPPLTSCVEVLCPEEKSFDIPGSAQVDVHLFHIASPPPSVGHCTMFHVNHRTRNSPVLLVICTEPRSRRAVGLRGATLGRTVHHHSTLSMMHQLTKRKEASEYHLGIPPGMQALPPTSLPVPHEDRAGNMARSRGPRKKWIWLVGHVSSALTSKPNAVM